MPERIPSPELIRFLLTKWPLSTMPLAEARRLSSRFSPAEWDGFRRTEIERDIRLAMADHAQTAVRDLAKPAVLCLFDSPHLGKTSFANLFRAYAVPIYSTDLFIGSLRYTWHADDELRALAHRHFPDTVDVFVGAVQQDADLAARFVELFFDEEHGFNEVAPASILEGYLHHSSEPEPRLRLDRAIAHGLTARGYLVWIANRSPDDLQPASPGIAAQALEPAVQGLSTRPAR